MQLGAEGRRFGGEELPLHYEIPLTPHLETATLMYSYEEVPGCIQPPSNSHIWQEWILCPALSCMGWGLGSMGQEVWGGDILKSQKIKVPQK